MDGGEMRGGDRYPRDLIGYGATPPRVAWPGGARLALQIVVNYEEGGENSILHGDAASEAFLTEEPAEAFPGRRNLNVESQYEYGSRAGFWRLRRLLSERGLTATCFGITTAMERNPEAVAAMQADGWELACHGLKWISYASMSPDEEARQIAEALERHRALAGAPALGWYTGRMSPNTRRILTDMPDLVYDSDSFADDLPYWVHDNGRPQLVVPYTLDNNDGRYLNGYGLQAPDFASYLIRALDLMRREGAEHPRMMSVGLHCRISGKPGRAADLERFLDHVAELGDVWVCRRIDIARHWIAHHQP
ncbi:polysaccharide deacetylase family protein [Paracoccus yeei]|nr:polysaccharide deacetylase family protein [Paracoccus yeei]